MKLKQISNQKARGLLLDLNETVYCINTGETDNAYDLEFNLLELIDVRRAVVLLDNPENMFFKKV